MPRTSVGKVDGLYLQFPALAMFNRNRGISDVAQQLRPMGIGLTLECTQSDLAMSGYSVCIKNAARSTRSAGLLAQIERTLQICRLD